MGAKTKGRKTKVIAQPVSPLIVRLTKRRSWLLSLAILGLLFAAGAGVLKNTGAPLLPIKSIELLGTMQHLDGKQVEQAVASSLRAGFFSVDVKAVKQEAEQLPWAQSVSVRRVWPDQLQIAVTEQKAMARWGDKAVLNAAGELFYPPAQAMPTDVVQLNGPKGSQHMLFNQYRELQDILAEQGLKISRLSLDKRRAMEMELDNGIHLMLGKVRGLSESAALISRFTQAYGKLLAHGPKKISSVDLRYANGFSVQWAEPNNSNKSTPARESPLGKAPKDVVYG